MQVRNKMLKMIKVWDERRVFGSSGVKAFTDILGQSPKALPSTAGQSCTPFRTYKNGHLVVEIFNFSKIRLVTKKLKIPSCGRNLLDYMTWTDNEACIIYLWAISHIAQLDLQKLRCCFEKQTHLMQSEGFHLKFFPAVVRICLLFLILTANNTCWICWHYTGPNFLSIRIPLTSNFMTTNNIPS